MNLSHLRKIALAAMRLAAVYAAMVGVLFAVVILVMEPPASAIRLLRSIVFPVGAAFTLSFVVLAVARRIGFALLWVLLIALWVRMLSQGPYIFLPMLFVFWTVVAAPLYAVIAIAVRDGAPPSGRLGGLVRRWGLIIGWTVPFIFALWTPVPNSSFEWGWRLQRGPLQALWAAVPLVVAMMSMWQLRALRPRAMSDAPERHSP